MEENNVSNSQGTSAQVAQPIPQAPLVVGTPPVSSVPPLVAGTTPVAGSTSKIFIIIIAVVFTVSALSYAGFVYFSGKGTSNQVTLTASVEGEAAVPVQVAQGSTSTEVAASSGTGTPPQIAQ